MICSFVASVGQRKNFESPTGIEPMASQMRSMITIAQSFILLAWTIKTPAFQMCTLSSFDDAEYAFRLKFIYLSSVTKRWALWDTMWELRIWNKKTTLKTEEHLLL